MSTSVFVWRTHFMQMSNECFYLVNSKILPDVVKGVIFAKELLASGKATNTSQAIKMAEISRSAFYKYKDYVFKYDDNEKNTLNLSAVLSDRAGVFSALTTSLYENGANIITVNQGIPVDSVATVSLTVRTDNIKLSLPSLLNKLKAVNGVISIKAI